MPAGLARRLLWRRAAPAQGCQALAGEAPTRRETLPETPRRVSFYRLMAIGAGREGPART